MCNCKPKISVVKTTADGKTNIETCRCGEVRILPATFEGIQDMLAINRANPSIIDKKPKSIRYYNTNKHVPKVDLLTGSQRYGGF